MTYTTFRKNCAIFPGRERERERERERGRERDKALESSQKHEVTET